MEHEKNSGSNYNIQLFAYNTFSDKTQCFSSQIQSFLFPEQAASRYFLSFAPSHIFPELDTDEQKGEKEGEGTITPLKERGKRKTGCSTKLRG